MTTHRSVRVYVPNKDGIYDFITNTFRVKDVSLLPEHVRTAVAMLDAAAENYFTIVKLAGVGRRWPTPDPEYSRTLYGVDAYFVYDVYLEVP